MGEKAGAVPSLDQAIARLPHDPEIQRIINRVSAIIDGQWGVMHDGPRGDGEPWKAQMEAAPGLTIASTANTEPIARVSGYLMPVKAHAEFLAGARRDVLYLLAKLGVHEKSAAPFSEGSATGEDEWKRVLQAVGGRVITWSERDSEPLQVALPAHIPDVSNCVYISLDLFKSIVSASVRASKEGK